MNRQNFINSNTNKNIDGFLLIDILLGLTLFTIVGYYFFSVLLKVVFLLQALIKNAIESNNQVFLTKALALGIPHDAAFIYDGNDMLSKNYIIEVKAINFFMNDGKKVVIDIVIVKSNTVDTVNRICYMFKNA